IFGTYNDGNCGSVGSNLGIMRVLSIDTTTGTKNAFACVNAMSSYGGIAAPGAPLGWAAPGGHGYCNAHFVPTCDDGWKTFGPVSVTVNGVNWLGLNVFRQEGLARYYGHDSTMIFSDDHGGHWCNPATILAHDGTCPHTAVTAAGDAPTAPGAENTI